MLTRVALPEVPATGAWSAREFAAGVRFGLPYVSSCRLSYPDVQVTGDTAVSDMRMTVHAAGGGLVVITADLKWGRRGKDWKVVEISNIRRGAGTVDDSAVAPGQHRTF